MKCIVLTLCLVGCTATPSRTEDFCAVASPILVDLAKDKMTDATKNQILNYNHIGVMLCGWKPPK